MEPAPPPPLGTPPPSYAGADYGAASASHAKADLGKRFVALLIDGIIGGVLFSVVAIVSAGLGWLLYAAYILVRDGLAYDFMDGRSVGKKVMKLRPVRLDGGAMNIETSVKRNLPMAAGTVVMGVAGLAAQAGMWGVAGAIGILGQVVGLVGLVEAILVLTDAAGRRFGDKFAGTQVIDAGA